MSAHGAAETGFGLPWQQECFAAAAGAAASDTSTDASRKPCSELVKPLLNACVERLISPPKIDKPAAAQQRPAQPPEQRSSWAGGMVRRSDARHADEAQLRQGDVREQLGRMLAAGSGADRVGNIFLRRVCYIEKKIA